MICNGNTVQSWEVNYADMFTLNNWIIQLDMYCTPKEYIGFIGALAFGGAALACFFLPVLGDKYGRWIIFQITMGIQIPLFLLALFTRNLAIVYFLCFFLGVTLIGRFTCGFVLLTELCPERYGTFVGTALMCGDSAATLYITFYYRFISKDSYPIFWVGLFLNVLTFFTTMFVPESAKWLISVK